ncbi:MAG: methyltransferase domain-containing protein [Bdellovibrio sp.]|nr:methyltransferase domain-containing protein [Bdellovibrio sp.]
MSKLFTYANSALLLSIISFVLLATSAKASAAVQCENLFSQNTNINDNPKARFDGMNITVDGVKVSGSQIKEIRADLDLTDALLVHLKENQQSVLSLGEGYSELLPFLVEKGIRVKGLDLWYHTPDLKAEKSTAARHMEVFQNLYASHLIRGTALNIPLKAESVDFVLSHHLLNSLHIAQQLRIITETIRILKVSGEAHLLLTDSREPQKGANFVLKTILHFINDNYAASINAQILNGLLIIDKVASTKTFDQLVIPFDEKEFYENLPRGSKARNEKEDESLLKSYTAAVALSKKNPDNFYLATEVRILETKLQAFRKSELGERSPLETWWLKLTSRFSIKPYIRQ